MIKFTPFPIDPLVYPRERFVMSKLYAYWRRSATGERRYGGAFRDSV